MNGTDLLGEFRLSGTESAFSELVRRYTNLVFSVAKRRLGNESLAQEVVQAVFIRLSGAHALPRTDAELGAWLHRTAVHVSVDLWRSETRRRAREEQSIVMHSNPSDTPAWNELAPVLDEALNELPDTDRQALVLRFFDGKSMREVGASFGVSEDAAKMRVGRALDRLRGQLSVKGVVCGTVALGVLMSKHGVEAAPTELVAKLASLSLSVATGSSVGILAGWVALIRAHALGSIAAALGVAVVTVLLLRGPGRPGPGKGMVLATVSNSDLTALAVPGDRTTTFSNENSDIRPKEPNPLSLLEAVVRARRKIVSGEMEMQLASFDNSRPLSGTNQIRLLVQFDGGKRRFESFGREYSYVSTAPDAALVADAAILERHLDRDAAIKAGLLRGFDAHIVSISDGERYLGYRESDGRAEGATIRSPRVGSGSYLFDPRLLGLSIELSAGQAIENNLDLDEAKAIQLVGRELVDGTPTWHVHMISKYGQRLEFWIDTDRPLQVVKHSVGVDEVRSIFDSSSPGYPLPNEVGIRVFHGTSFSSATRIAITRASGNSPIESVRWTLAGLGMAVGTSVTDERVRRRLGYWTGSGLSENIPSKDEVRKSVPDQAEQLLLLDNDPQSRAALEAAQWIIMNTPDGPEVDKAAQVIKDWHIGSKYLLDLAVELERLRHAASQKLLEAILEKNPEHQIRGNACFSMAVLRKVKAAYGRDQLATGEAEQLFERAIREFGQATRRGRKLADLARPELEELRHLTIGKPAPEIYGEDMEGRGFTLSEYKGKTVVLLFWLNNCPSADERRELRELAVRQTGKPFALIGVNCDTDSRRQESQSLWQSFEANFRSFDDGNGGPISTAWNVQAWPTFVVLDARGIIRYRGIRGLELNEAVDTLMTEGRAP